MIHKNKPSPRSISRLNLCRHLLATQLSERVERIYSHALGRAAGVSAAQVRRDIMGLGHSGTPNNGYDVRALIDDISDRMDQAGGQQVGLVGVGNLGRAILSYFSSGRKTKLKIVAAFDSEPEKVDRVLYGCRCYSLEQTPQVVRAEEITTGIIAVPAAVAQRTSDQLVSAGITGILNFAPVPITTPPLVYVEQVDITVKLGTVAYFAQKLSPLKSTTESWKPTQARPSSASSSATASASCRTWPETWVYESTAIPADAMCCSSTYPARRLSTTRRSASSAANACGCARRSRAWPPSISSTAAAEPGSARPLTRG
jgi:redox-sensing transcriptional repressor